ncbi:MAG TPA: TPM domain-containing protein [Candidatus Limnocylindria bacterium]|nr:TPM domain-containing protein [Candidatus Limnocylindria bacterium]
MLMRGAAVLALGGALVAGCGLVQMPPPQLVRDEAGLFSPQARMEAERRLQQLAREHGVWLFVLTDPNPDPPRMMDAPMAEAAAADAVVVAVMLGPDRVAAGGSRDGDAFFEPPSAADTFLADGRRDDALGIIVKSFAAWAPNPESVGADGAPPRPAQPSGP